MLLRQNYVSYANPTITTVVGGGACTAKPGGMLGLVECDRQGSWHPLSKLCFIRMLFLSCFRCLRLSCGRPISCLCAPPLSLFVRSQARWGSPDSPRLKLWLSGKRHPRRDQHMRRSTARAGQRTCRGMLLQSSPSHLDDRAASFCLTFLGLSQYLAAVLLWF